MSSAAWTWILWVHGGFCELAEFSVSLLHSFISTLSFCLCRRLKLRWKSLFNFQKLQLEIIQPLQQPCFFSIILLKQSRAKCWLHVWADRSLSFSFSCSLNSFSNIFLLLVFSLRRCQALQTVGELLMAFLQQLKRHFFPRRSVWGPVARVCNQLQVKRRLNGAQVLHVHRLVLNSQVGCDLHGLRGNLEFEFDVDVRRMRLRYYSKYQKHGDVLLDELFLHRWNSRLSWRTWCWLMTQQTDVMVSLVWIWSNSVFWMEIKVQTSSMLYCELICSYFMRR